MSDVEIMQYSENLTPCFLQLLEYFSSEQYTSRRPELFELYKECDAFIHFGIRFNSNFYCSRTRHRVTSTACHQIISRTHMHAYLYQYKERIICVDLYVLYVFNYTTQQMS